MPFLIKMFYFFILSIHFIFFFGFFNQAGKVWAVEVGLDKRFKELLYILDYQVCQRADFFVREKNALTHVKQQHAFWLELSNVFDCVSQKDNILLS
jgi:hypothetical protein